jgi:hypothetical protein
MLITLDPTGIRPRDQGTRRMAARRPLAGARVGLVSNGLGRTEALLMEVYRLLRESAGAGGAFLVRKPHRSTPPRPEDWEKLLSDADVVIAGFGGCGSCSTRSVRDAMELEWEGIPSVALVHEDMLPGVQAMTRLAGMPDYRYVVVDRGRTSLCDWDDATVESVASQVAGEVAALLGSATPAGLELAR